MAVVEAARQTDRMAMSPEEELAESFDEIALADSGKIMLPVELIEEGSGAEDNSNEAIESVDRKEDESPSASGPSDSIYSGPSDVSRHSGPRSLAPLGDYIGKKDLLLRLFQSDYFDAWIGLAYLWRYNGKDVGLQYFICERMRQRPLGEIEFVLPQIW